MITLYQFPFSHFCEKARWALEHKGLEYERKNLLPGLHLLVTRKLAPQTCVPILVDGDTVVQDSPAIISFLDDGYPDHPLTPSDPREAREAMEWEHYLDEEIGVPLRLWFYYHALPDRERALGFLLTDAAWYGRALFPYLFPRIRKEMAKAMNIHAESAGKAKAQFLAALDRLDAALETRRYLVGNQFSRADLTACALLSPYCAPGASNATVKAAFPPPIAALRDEHSTRRFFQWVLDIHEAHRHPARTQTLATP